MTLFERRLALKACANKTDDKKMNIFPTYLTLGSLPVDLDVSEQGVATDFFLILRPEAYNGAGNEDEFGEMHYLCVWLWS